MGHLSYRFHYGCTPLWLSGKKVGFISDSLRSLILCMMIMFIRLYTFTPVSLTLIRFEIWLDLTALSGQFSSRWYMYTDTPIHTHVNTVPCGASAGTVHYFGWKKRSMEWRLCFRRVVWNRPWWMHSSATVWTLSSCCWRTASACTPFSPSTGSRSSTTPWVLLSLCVQSRLGCIQIGPAVVVCHRCVSYKSCLLILIQSFWKFLLLTLKLVRM